jgi:hypothetical protein
VNKYIKGKKLLNDFCELNNFKNIHVIDGSTIKEGLHYPTYFLMLHARYISKKIILMKKKTRININTSFKIYIKVFLSFIFFQRKKNEIVFKNALKKFF